MVKIPKLECKKCGHKWAPRIPNPPTCPHCRTYYWNKPKQGVRDGDNDDDN